MYIVDLPLQKQNKALILAQFILHITLDNHIYIILLLSQFMYVSVNILCERSPFIVAL